MGAPSLIEIILVAIPNSVSDRSSVGGGCSDLLQFLSPFMFSSRFPNVFVARAAVQVNSFWAQCNISQHFHETLRSGERAWQ